MNLNCMNLNHYDQESYPSNNYNYNHWNPMMNHTENYLFSSSTINHNPQNDITSSNSNNNSENYDDECFHVYGKLTNSGETVAFTFQSQVPENQEAIPFDINYTKPSFNTHVPLIEYTFNPNDMVSINKSDKAIYGLCVKYGDLILKTVPMKFYSVETCYGKCGKRDELYKKLQHNFINICDFGGNQCPLTLCIEFDLSRHVDKNGKKHKKKTTVGYGIHSARISKSETYGVFKTICCTCNKFTVKIFQKKKCYCSYTDCSKYEFLLIRKELHNRTAKKSIVSEPAIIQWKSSNTLMRNDNTDNCFINETKNFDFHPVLDDSIDDNCSIQSSIPSSSSVSSGSTFATKRRYPYPVGLGNNHSTRRKLNDYSVVGINKYNFMPEGNAVSNMSSYLNLENYDNSCFNNVNQVFPTNFHYISDEHTSKFNCIPPSPDPLHYNFSYDDNFYGNTMPYTDQ